MAVAAPAQASLGHDLGELLLNQPCCNGAALQGSRSHILFPNSPQVGNLRQVLSLVGAQDDKLQTNELGMTMDDNLVLNGDTSCFKPYNTVVSFYEWWDYAAGGGTHCKALGQVTAGHLYSTAQQSNNKFQFFIDGVAQLSSPLVQMGGTHAPNADNLAAGGEVTYDASVGGPEPVNWQAGFGGNGNTPWQRFNNSQGWVTFQNNGICNGPQNVCTGGGWSFSTASYPTTWSVIH